ncbi:ArsC family reductase [Thorsellia anophelis]|uniref:Transcriptional regulator, Spx/MgsR family n=1 Tax=Thorsellia anophelis DSM 18579 TaxID=1123402 RepID=A0A1I0CJH0_9GAMM|nr:ArsC family reductase [Thorsellia anophelis]SET19313.1 transcriptional regulator, Spx/MgsR family [Thorsellia anophelis DSM 18579]
MNKFKITIYGIKNCDKIKKAKTWLELQDIGYTFVDYRKDGISDEFLQRQIEKIGVDSLINKRGTTWRNLSETDKSNLDNIDHAVNLLKTYPALIKRPLLIANPIADEPTIKLLGFSAKQYLNFFNELFTKTSPSHSMNMKKGIA